MMVVDLKEEILRLKKEREALILAHNYQIEEIQEVADFVGDSLELAIKAGEAEEKVIVFCGVKFMAELVKIISPDKVVLHPRPDSRCPLAEFATPEKVLEFKRRHGNPPVVAYVNTYADVKAVSDVICTSANAPQIVRGLDSSKVIFLPDENLGSWVQEQVRDKEIIIYRGFCYVHSMIKPEEVKKLKEKYPDAFVIAHPEAKPEVRALAHHVASTGGMVRFVREHPEIKRFIIVTEREMTVRLRRDFPDREFIPVPGAVCSNMKKITLKDLYLSLRDGVFEVQLPEDTIQKARGSIRRMFEIMNHPLAQKLR